MTQILINAADITRFRQLQQGKTLALVPTMGNLHKGHLSLVRLAQAHADIVMVSIFVNPTQFGENEDLAAYPRTFDADWQKLQSAAVDAVFVPEETTIYPHGQDNTLSIEMPKSMTTILCGINRPTHFQGVATVVTKLFQLIHPDVAVFGEKDFQQLAIIRRLNEELFMNIKLLGSEIVREPDGLAMSSRNQYLNPEERQQAAGLFKVLQSARARLLAGEALNTVLNESKEILIRQGFTVDYLDCRDIISLAESTDIAQAVLLAAARIGNTRLIDNLRITPL